MNKPPAATLAPAGGARPAAAPRARADYFVEADGATFAGRHVLIDLWGAHRLDDVGHIETALGDAVAACQATLLHLHVHRFESTGGVSGVAVLAESHISIHTWPERAFAAVDIFMCGNCDPYAAVPVLERAFAAATVTVDEARRGVAR